MIGIHERRGGFSDRWVESCKERGISYKRIDCLASDVVEQCAGLKAVLWHWTLNDPRELLVARQVIAALERTGLAVFPSLDTCWHYDDKIAQKHMLEAVGAPVIPTWVFTDRERAEEWIETASWPKVFKLRCGAGSSNVRLVRSKSEAHRLCRVAFGRGFPAEMVRLDAVRSYVRAARGSKELGRRAWNLGKRALRRVLKRDIFPVERGYVYFQEFLDGNPFDTRVTVIGERAFAFTRENRPGDFRASGSGRISYDDSKVSPECIKIAFGVTRRLGAQSLAFDFLFNDKGGAVVGEVSYCYVAGAVHGCPGHWDDRLGWHSGQMWPQDAILEDICERTGWPVSTGGASTLVCGE